MTKEQQILSQSEIILRNEGKPLPYRDITRLLMDGGLELGGKTPEGSVSAILSKDVKLNPKTVFNKLSRGIYGLISFGVNENQVEEKTAVGSDIVASSVNKLFGGKAIEKESKPKLTVVGKEPHADNENESEDEDHSGLITGRGIKESALKRVRENFEIIEKYVNGICKQIINGLVLQGGPGTGKTYEVLKILRKWAEETGLEFVRIPGKITPIQLYIELYNNREKGQIILLDDADAALQQEDSLNIMKAVLELAQTRTVSYKSSSAILDKEDIPKTFDYEGSIIIISNLNFYEIVQKDNKVSPHIAAIMDRCLVTDAGCHVLDEKLARLHYVIKHGNFLSNIGLDDHQSAVICNFFYKNRHNLRELSIRTLEAIAKIYHLYHDAETLKDDPAFVDPMWEKAALRAKGKPEFAL